MMSHATESAYQTCFRGQEENGINVLETSGCKFIGVHKSPASACCQGQDSGLASLKGLLCAFLSIAHTPMTILDCGSQKCSGACRKQAEEVFHTGILQELKKDPAFACALHSVMNAQISYEVLSSTLTDMARAILLREGITSL